MDCFVIRGRYLEAVPAHVDAMWVKNEWLIICLFLLWKSNYVDLHSTALMPCCHAHHICGHVCDVP